jgi:3-phosphoshikimate 1-carboxyvinyltransferase
MGGLGKVVLKKFTLPEGIVEVHLPASKSISNRLLIMQALSEGAVQISNLSNADDTMVLKSMLTEQKPSYWLGAAGTALRFGLAWAAITPGERILRGTDRLHIRPLKPLIKALEKLGAEIECYEDEGFAPVEVNGRKLRHALIDMDASVSSQFTSALMLIGPYISGGLDIARMGKRVSEPYVEMTASLMRSAGAYVHLRDGKIEIEEWGYQSSAFVVESDWSAASYFYSVVALGGPTQILLTGLHVNSIQGDSALTDIFKEFAVQTEFTSAGAFISRKGKPEEKIELDCTAFPDLAQTIAATAAGLKIPCRLTGLSTLKVKETDRIAALATELGKCGTTCETGDDFIVVSAFTSPEKAPVIATYHDHRMAMAFAPLALVFPSFTIESPEVVSKSFPDFWQELSRCGVAFAKSE